MTTERRERLGYEVETDQIVADIDGTVWVYQPATESWSYVVMNSDGSNRVALSWDSREALPGYLEPYLVLDLGGANAIRQVLGMPRHLSAGIY